MKFEEKFTKLRFASYYPTFIVSICLILLLFYTEKLNSNEQNQKQRKRVFDEVSKIRSKMEGHVNSDAFLIKGLVASIVAQPKMTQSQFNSIAKHIMTDQPLLKNMAMAPDLVIKYVYPIKGNEKVVGLDYKKIPKQLKAVLEAKETRKVVIAGPINLVQGGEGFIARTPIFIDKEFFGIVSTVISSEKLYEVSGLLNDTNFSKIALRGKDGKGSNGAVFFGDPDIFNQEPEILDITLPYGSWQIAGISKLRWLSAAPDLSFRINTFLASLFLFCVVFFLNFLFIKKQKSDLRFKHLFHTTPIPIGIMGDNGDVIELNKQFQELFGYSKKDIPTLKDWAMKAFPNENYRFEVFQTWESAVGKAFEDNLIMKPVEFEVVCKNGEHRFVEASGHRFEEITIATFIDITERRQNEIEIRQAKDIAEHASYAKTEFLSNMSHELRTPLNAIIGFSELLQDSEMSEDDLSLVKDIKNAGDHLHLLINDVLDLSRIETGNFDLHMVPTSVNSSIEDCLKLVEGMAKIDNVTLSFKRGEELYALADELRLKQLLLNVLSNAIKYNKDDGEVTVFLEKSSSDEVKIMVKDTGVGISSESLDEIFLPFNRLHSTKYKAEGTGIGLALTKKLVELMNGRVEVTSTLNEGTSFIIYLPEEKVVKKAEKKDVKLELVSTQEKENEKKVVLYIEDNFMNQKLVSLVIKSHCRAKLILASNGEDGVELAKEHHPDLILVDISLPDISGFEILRRLKMDESFNETPIVALSANAMKHDIEKGLDSGFTDYLTKPIKTPALSKKINDILAS